MYLLEGAVVQPSKLHDPSSMDLPDAYSNQLQMRRSAFRRNLLRSDRPKLLGKATTRGPILTAKDVFRFLTSITTVMKANGRAVGPNGWWGSITQPVGLG
jgi:hypothetical protein